MSTTRIKSLLLGTCMAAAGALGGVGSAQAAVYTGNWDPIYGAAFAGLGWQASAKFDVPDACLALGNGSFGISGACAGFQVLSAKVDFYDTSAPSTITESFDLHTNVIVNGIDLAGGNLVGIDTGFFDSFVPALGDGYYAFSLILFDGTQAQLAYAHPATRSPICSYQSTPDCGLSEHPAVGVFAPIPEPET